MAEFLRPLSMPGLLITGTDTGIGKTVIAGAIARQLRLAGKRVAVCKPCGSGCVHRREGLVSEDAEFLAHCAGSPHPLHIVCPQRYAEPLAPAVAGQRAGQPLDWAEVQRCIDEMSTGSEVMIIEGVGGIMVPMDEKHTMLDVASWLNVPAVVVARAGLGTINHTLLTVNALRARGVRVAGVVINNYPAENPGVAEETNPKAIEKWGKVPVLCIVPRLTEKITIFVPPDIAAPIESVDWLGLARPQ
jgi:dethiobiotin synthetase